VELFLHDNNKKSLMNKNENLPDSNLTSGSHISYWTDSVKPLSYGPLTRDIHTDVVIVGAGIAGLSVAYCAALKGKVVTVIDDGSIASGESGRTTAHLSNALDDRYYEIERIFGEEGSKLAAESHTMAINFIEKVCNDENIDCDFKRLSGYLFLNPTDDESSIEKEFEAAKKAGIPVKKLQSVPYLKNQNSPCIEFPDQGQFHPGKYLNGLAHAIVSKGGAIFNETHAEEIDETGVVTSAGHKISAKHIVVCTNSPVNNKYVMHMKQFPYRTYVIGATVRKGTVPYALWWDTGDHKANKDVPPYHYIRLQEYNDEFDLLIVGGEDHPTGLPELQAGSERQSYKRLEAWARDHFDIQDIIYHWSGQVLEPMDAMGFIGHNPMDKDNIYIATGDSGNGMTHGTIAGLLISDLIVGTENAWEKIYRPTRTNFLKSGKTFLHEFFRGLVEYLKQTSKDVEDRRLENISPGEAIVLKLDDEKYGAYRDKQGELHLVSATCTHLGCTVRWNKDEKSWDCPCHGSRFSYDGKVLNGPAKEELLYHKDTPVSNSSLENI
jgi:glycine/D-amino acid oxidase-like deaminating enzyme/nitrite reductase/ring-hydroxylating ferredoxin subunit